MVVVVSDGRLAVTRNPETRTTRTVYPVVR